MDKKDSVVRVEEQGSIHIAEDVICSIAALAAMEVEGVSSISSGTPNLLLKKNPSKGVKLTIDGSRVSVDISIVAAYGCVIDKVAAKVQEQIKNSLVNMAGLEIIGVNVHVSGVSFDKHEEK